MRRNVGRLTLGGLFLTAAVSTGAAGQGAGCGNQPEDPGGGCGAPSTGFPLGGCRILTPSGVAEIDFEMSDHHILLPVSVDGSEPFRLVLDTGMPIPGAMLHPSPRTDALDLKNPDGLRLAVAGSEGPDPRVGTGVTLGLPAVELTDQLVGIIPLPGCTQPDVQALFAESRVEGVIGLSIFQNFVVTIDYDRRVVTLVDPERFVHDGRGVEIPLTLGPTSVPEVTCEVEIRPRKRIPVNVVVDTGATYALSLTLGTNDGIFLPEGARDWVVGYSNWGRVTGSLGRARSVHIGELALHDVLVTFFRKGASGVPPCGEHGILGNEALSRFNTTFDYSRKRMILVPNGSVNEPFEFDMSGMRYEKNEANGLRVVQVLPDSPASEAGLREGDLITSVNGRAAGEYPPEELDGILRTKGARVRLHVARAGRGMDIELRLRRLV